MGEILMIMIGAILAENFVFTRFLGIYPFLAVSEKPSAVITSGVAMTFVMTISAAATWIIYHKLLVTYELEYLRTLAFALIIAALVQLIELSIKKYFAGLYKTIGTYLPLIAMNCAVFGAAFINIDSEYSFVNAVLFGLFAAIGFVFATVIFAGVRERLYFSEPPEAFKGIPIALVTAGLIAMAFAGFQNIEISKIFS